MMTSRQSHRRSAAARQRSLHPRSLHPRLLARIAGGAVLALAALSSYAHYDIGLARASTAQTHPTAPHPAVPGGSPTPTPPPTPAAPTHIWRMPTPVAVPPAPTLTGYVMAVTQPNTTVSGSCSAGTSVQITAPHAHVTISGHCAAVVITADSVILNVDQFNLAYISGKHVTVLYQRGTPTVHNYGAGTHVTKV
ncbi:hypothetical protein SAMN05892883_1494 [Jatrophihabitans sp. GAS493]|uniref:DUF3060 domain-containing protein n=1 Tax=Jatrophihabitans sp. GAS493 TaxID=1907575 RepID=UPI000BB7AD51|nr:DUF3060 domain-containing protein [Jatrophihabitans sp. GAS493]SOD72054.1 hypothetical protein SAMN05892883_1494 [Jatrophihabitans sp. GAS493]